MQTALWIVLGILKILGIVVLGILTLLLTILLLILVVPVRYRIQGSYYGKPKGQAGVSWLFPLVSVKAIYEEKLTVAVRILGFCVFRREKTFGKGKDGPAGEERLKEETGFGTTEAGTDVSVQPEKKDRAEPDLRREGSERVEVVSTELEGPENKKTGGESEEPENLAEEPERREEESKSQEEKSESQAEKSEGLAEESEGPSGRKKKKSAGKKQGFSFYRVYDKLKKKIQKLWERLKKFPGKLRKTAEDLIRRKEGVLEKKERLFALLRDEANRRTARLLKRQVWAICRHILPVRITGQIRFGFDDPSVTGQVLAYISLFYGLYARSLQIIPVFDESVMEGQGKIKGRIRIGTVIVLAVRMLFDKNFRGWLRKLRKA